MLKLVRDRSPGTPIDRLSVARAHLQAAILHINNEAQRRVPSSAAQGDTELNSLRLMVCALADIVFALSAEQLARGETAASRRSAAVSDCA